MLSVVTNKAEECNGGDGRCLGSCIKWQDVSIKRKRIQVAALLDVL